MLLEAYISNIRKHMRIIYAMDQFKSIIIRYIDQYIY